MILPLSPSWPVLPSSKTPKILSEQEKEQHFHKIFSSQRKNIAAIFISVVVFILAFATFLLGCLLCIPVMDSGVGILSEVVLPLLLPSLLAMICISLPLLLYAYKQQKNIEYRYHQVALSNYAESLRWCVRHKEEEQNRNNLANFMRSALFSEYSRQFSFFSLTKTVTLLSEKETSPYDELIKETLLYVKDEVFMSRLDQDARRREERDGLRDDG